MNIVIPAAGVGSRFVQAGYQIPKPFIPIKGKPMLEWVIDNISTERDKVYILTRLDHLPYLRGTDLAFRDNICFIPVEKPTEGAACTVLRARQFIDNDEPLLIANSDQYVKYDRERWQALLNGSGKVFSQGVIMTFNSKDPKWSYAKVDKYGGMVSQVAEKQVISAHATVGIYYYFRGRLFCEGADRMIAGNTRVNGEFYVCPVFNELVDKYNINIFPVDSMYGLGTPEDLQANQDFVGT